MTPNTHDLNEWLLSFRARIKKSKTILDDQMAKNNNLSASVANLSTRAEQQRATNVIVKRRLGLKLRADVLTAISNTLVKLRSTINRRFFQLEEFIDNNKIDSSKTFWDFIVSEAKKENFKLFEEAKSQNIKF